MRLVLQTLLGRSRGHHFGVFTVTKSAFSLTNFKHETILTPGVTLLIVKAPCPAFFGHGTELNDHRVGKLGTIVRQDHGK